MTLYFIRPTCPLTAGREPSALRLEAVPLRRDEDFVEAPTPSEPDQGQQVYDVAGSGRKACDLGSAQLVARVAVQGSAVNAGSGQSPTQPQAVWHSSWGRRRRGRARSRPSPLGGRYRAAPVPSHPRLAGASGNISRPAITPRRPGSSRRIGPKPPLAAGWRRASLAVWPNEATTWSQSLLQSTEPGQIARPGGASSPTLWRGFEAAEEAGGQGSPAYCVACGPRGRGGAPSARPAHRRVGGASGIVRAQRSLERSGGGDCCDGGRHPRCNRT